MDPISSFISIRPAPPAPHHATPAASVSAGAIRSVAAGIRPPSDPPTVAHDPSFGLAAAGLHDQYRPVFGGKPFNIYYPLCITVRESGGYKLRLDLVGLRFAKVRRSQTEEIAAATGGLVARTVHLRDRNGPLIRRFIQPFSGCGQYSGFVRSVGYAGKIVLGDSNELICLMQQQILRYPDQVAREVAALLNAIAPIARMLGVDVNADQSFECVNPATVRQLRGRLRDFFARRSAALPIRGFGWNSSFAPDSPQIREALCTAAALIWLAQESKWSCNEVRLNQHGNSVCYPMQLCNRIRKTPASYRVFDRTISREHVHLSFKALQGIFSGYRCAGEHGHLDTEIAGARPRDLLAMAGTADFVVLNADRAHDNFQLPAFLAGLGWQISKPWRAGARILIVTSASGSEAQSALDRLGLLTSVQRSSLKGSPRSTVPAEFLLAMNFDPSDPQHALLAPPVLPWPQPGD